MIAGPIITTTPASTYTSAPFTSARWVPPANTMAQNFIMPASITNTSAGVLPLSNTIYSQALLQNSHILPSSNITGSRKRNSSSIKVSKLTYRAPDKLETDVPSDAFIPYYSSKEECVICQEKFSAGSSIKLSVCKHNFHLDCIKQALKVSSQCPICRKVITEPRGKSPSGTMSSSSSSIQCDGYQGVGSIAIDYHIKGELQKSYHDNPGTIQVGKSCRAYLPNNRDGQKLLKRLKYAFLHGLTFTVGTSLTTGIQNQCTWSSIHHKTSLHGGTSSHGFPDPSYLINCNDELNSLGIPLDSSLRDDGTIA